MRVEVTGLNPQATTLFAGNVVLVGQTINAVSFDLTLTARIRSSTRRSSRSPMPMSGSAVTLGAPERSYSRASRAPAFVRLRWMRPEAALLGHEKLRESAFKPTEIIHARKLVRSPFP